MEFSKLIQRRIEILVAVVVAFTLVMIWRTDNVDPLTYLIPAVFAAKASSDAFYFNKAKAENLIKLQQLGIKVEEEDNNE